MILIYENIVTPYFQYHFVVHIGFFSAYIITLDCAISVPICLFLVGSQLITFGSSSTKSNDFWSYSAHAIQFLGHVTSIVSRRHYGSPLTPLAHLPYSQAHFSVFPTYFCTHVKSTNNNLTLHPLLRTSISINHLLMPLNFVKTNPIHLHADRFLHHYFSLFQAFFYIFPM